MSKRHSRLIEYFITVGIEFESVAPINDDTISNPIRELRIISEKQLIPDGYECIKTTVTGKDASLTKKSMMMKNNKHYLCYSREGTDQLFTRIQYNKAKHMSSKGYAMEWNRVPGKIMSGKTEYCLCTKNDTSIPPIADICIITIDGKESCPDGYVKLPSTINNLAICFRHLPMDALGLRYQTCILDRYPRKDYANSPLSNTVAVFCQPNGADIRAEASMPTFLSFVLTDSEGKKMYAITVTFYDKLDAPDEQQCIRSLQQIYTEGFKPIWPVMNNNNSGKSKALYHSKSVCILSYYPFFLSFREVLKEIYRLANSPGKIPIERYIINLCEETPLPVPNRRCVQLLYAHKPVVFRIPHEDELPLLDSNIKKIFCCLSLNNMLLLFKVLITQKYKILFTSSHISLITEICETLTSFLQPFEWQFTYVPVLPYSVFGILDAPVPVLVGMHSSRIKPDYYSDPEKEIIIVDLDNNHVHIPHHVHNELIDIPNNMHKILKSDLKQYAKANKVSLFDKNTRQFIDSAFTVQLMMDDDDLHMNGMDETFNPMACRAAFYRFWIKLLGPNYKTYLKFPDEDDIWDITNIFDIDGFINSRPKGLRKFWRQFSETQAFQKFIEDLTYESTEDRAVALCAFYKCCQHEHKEGDDNFLHSVQKKKLSAANISASLSLSSYTYESPKSQSFGSKSPALQSLDPFTQFLQDRIPVLKHYQVPQANENQLDNGYKYKVETSFPTLNDDYLIKPRVTNLLDIIRAEYEAKHEHKIIKPIDIGIDTVSDLPVVRARANAPNKQKKPGKKGGKSFLKNQTPMDRAKLQLLQIYGTWFAAHVAALDFKDIPGDAVQQVVRKTLWVLYRMTDLTASRDVCIIPDELIYKACLILCGKFGKKKEASKLFKDLKKNGIQPSAKTYGAYTNAMASSGANMLLSAAGSTSSGASSMAGRGHRRSFAPTVDGHVNKIRSLSAAIGSRTIRLHAPHKINTIAEDEERDGVGVSVPNGSGCCSSPYSEYDEEKTHLVLGPMKSSPFVNLGALQEKETMKPPLHPMHKSVEITLTNNDSNDVDVDLIPPRILSVKSQPNVNVKYLVHHGLNNSSSTPTPSPKLEDDVSPDPVAPSSEEDNNNNKITPQVWRDESPSVSEANLEVKEAQVQVPTNNNTEKLKLNVLSSQASASISATPEPNGTDNKSSSDRIATIIDYASLEVCIKHECKCGYVLADAQIMVGWCSEFTDSNNLRCIMCRQNTFSPRLHLRYHITKMSMQNGICSFETIDKFIEYISPLQLRSKINFILQHRRLDFEDPDMFRNSHTTEFWNMIWYFHNRQLDLSFLLGEHDSNVLEIRPYGFHQKKKDKNNADQTNKLEPKSDEELLEKLRPIYTKAINGKMREAISDWLLNRSHTPSEERELWIWNLSVFDSFHDLGIQSRYKTYDLFVKDFKNACRNIRPKIRDRAWDDPSLAIQIAFKHPRISNQRLQEITSKLSGKPARPQIPVPLPPTHKKN